MNDFKKSRENRNSIIKLEQLIINSMSCALMIVIYFVGNTWIAIGLYLILVLLSLKNKLVPFIVLGGGNYLPIVKGVSPVFIGVILLGISVVYECIKSKTLKFPSIKLQFLLLLMITFWSGITGLGYNDISFFKNLIMIDIFYIVVIFYCANVKVSSNEMLNSFIWGVMAGVILTFFIKVNVPGFTSNHIYRLALGERSDPNSTGLLFAISSIFLFLKMMNYMRKSITTFLLFTSLFICSLICLLLTQSRGSFLTLLITSGIYIWERKEKLGGTILKTTLINMCILLGCGIIFLVVTPSLTAAIGNIWKTLLERLSIDNIGGGARIYLFIMSIRSFLANPILGVDLNTFKDIAGHIPHNTFSDYMVTNGIIGIIFFILFFIGPLLYITKYKKISGVKEPYFCYVACLINILCYSASNEKIIYLLNVIVFLAIKENVTYLSRKEVNSEESYYVARCH